MHTVFALLCFVVVIHWLIFPYPTGLLHWHCGNLTIAPVPAKQPWWIWINTSCEFIINDCITTIKQSTTKPCAYFLGYTVWVWRYKKATKRNYGFPSPSLLPIIVLGDLSENDINDNQRILGIKYTEESKSNVKTHIHIAVSSIVSWVPVSIFHHKARKYWQSIFSCHPTPKKFSSVWDPYIMRYILKFHTPGHKDCSIVYERYLKHWKIVIFPQPKTEAIPVFLVFIVRALLDSEFQ